MPSLLKERVRAIAEETQIIRQEAEKASGAIDDFFCNLMKQLEDKMADLLQALSTEVHNSSRPLEAENGDMQESSRRYKIAT